MIRAQLEPLTPDFDGPPVPVAPAPLRRWPSFPSDNLLLQVMHRLSAVAVLLLAGGLAVAYENRDAAGGGSLLLAIALLVAFVALLAGLAMGKARRAGRFTCVALIGVIGLAILADQFGWLAAIANAAQARFEQLSTQHLPRRRPR